MKNMFISILFLLVTVSYAQTIIGDGASPKDVTRISTILAAPKNYIGQKVTVQGNVIKVCKHSGCKMMLASDKKYQTLMIKTASRKLFFPITAIGRKAFATGIFTKAPKEKDHAECDEKYIYIINATGATIL